MLEEKNNHSRQRATLEVPRSQYRAYYSKCTRRQELNCFSGRYRDNKLFVGACFGEGGESLNTVERSWKQLNIDNSADNWQLLMGISNGRSSNWALSKCDGLILLEKCPLVIRLQLKKKDGSFGDFGVSQAESLPNSVCTRDRRINRKSHGTTFDAQVIISEMAMLKVMVKGCLCFRTPCPWANPTKDFTINDYTQDLIITRR